MGNLDKALCGEAARSEFERLAEMATARAQKHHPPAYDPSRWFVLLVWCREELAAVKWLRTWGAVPYAPVQRVAVRTSKMLSREQRRTARARDTGRLVERPIFPGYVFAQAGEIEVPFDSVPHVRAALKFGDNPVHVHGALIDLLREREQEGFVKEEQKPPVPYKVGEGVRVTAGPFAAYAGVVDQLLDTRLDVDARIRVAIDIFGRQTPVDLSLDQIEKL